MVHAWRAREGEKPHAARAPWQKSDEVVVPRKPAKTRVTPVETVEGRAEAKGKAVARNTLPTQGGAGVSTDLRRLGQRAKERKTERFTNLLSHLKLPLLEQAYHSLRKDAAAGEDQQTWKQYGQGLKQRLLDLKDRIHRGTYRAPPVRRVHIPKGDGQLRALGIPTLEDKIMQQAVRQVLEPIYEAMFLGFS